MQPKQTIILAAVILAIPALHAQNKKPVFNSAISIGFTAGVLPVAFTAQTVQGVVYKNWFAGAGFGIDRYYMESWPLFFSVKRIFPAKGNMLFAYANTGKNLVLKNRVLQGAISTIETRGSVYADAGLGYQVKFGKKNSGIFISIGNAFKEINILEASTNNPTPFSLKTSHRHSYISMKLGFQF